MNQSIKKTKWILLYYDILKEMKLIEYWRVTCYFYCYTSRKKYYICIKQIFLEKKSLKYNLKKNNN